MRQLAEALGCSPKTPYRYFKDKADILATVRAQAFAKFADALEKAANGVTTRRARPADQRGLSRLRAPEPACLSHHVRARHAGRREPSRAWAAGRARGALVTAAPSNGGGGVIDVDPTLFGWTIWAASHGIVMLTIRAC